MCRVQLKAPGWACTLAFSWQPVVIGLVPARLPRNWHLGNEMPMADGGTWLCWDWERGAKWEGNGIQSRGWAEGSIKHTVESCGKVSVEAAAGNQPSPEDGFDPSAYKALPPQTLTLKNLLRGKLKGLKKNTSFAIFKKTTKTFFGSLAHDETYQLSGRKQLAICMLFFLKSMAKWEEKKNECVENLKLSLRRRGSVFEESEICFLLVFLKSSWQNSQMQLLNELHLLWLRELLWLSTQFPPRGLCNGLAVEPNSG